MKTLLKLLLAIIGLIVVGCGLLLVLTPSSKPTASGTPIATLTITEIKEQARTDISYDDLARFSENYVGEYVYYRGEVVQVGESGKFDTILRVNVTEGEWGFWTDTIFVDWKRAPDDVRVLEDDIVGVWGQVLGRKEYTSLFGQQIIIPWVKAVVVEVEGK